MGFSSVYAESSHRVLACKCATPPCCTGKPLMAHQYLNRVQVGAGLEQVCRITVP
jgi:hypothetical protein